MTLVLLMVFVISVAMGIGFVLCRIWQMRSDLEQQLEALLQCRTRMDS